MITFLSTQEIEDAVESFLEKYHPERSLPVPIEEILDLKLGIHIIPTPDLFNQHHIDAFLSSDLKGLHIDQDHLESRYSRARYSLAHEAGHLVLHQNYLASLEMDSLENWKEIVLGKGRGHVMMETQANMFASFLLMPESHLKREFEKEKMELHADPFFNQANFLMDEMTVVPFVEGKMGQIFDVSEEAVHYRLIHWANSQRKEKR